MTHPKHNTKAALWRLALLWAAILMLLLSSCDRIGRAPEDLDYTPTPPPPTAIPTPTPLPDDHVVEVSESQLVLEAILAAAPDLISSGPIQWQRDYDRGTEIPPRVENGFKIFYNGTGGGQANITFAIFDTPDEATAHFEFIGELRDVLVRLGAPDETFPSPNLFGSGTYGSNSIFIINEVYFVEVSIPQFPSTAGNPLVSLSQAAIDILDASLAGYNLVDVKPERLNALLSVLPDEIAAEDIVWQRRVSRDPQVIEDIEGGLGVRVVYNEESGSEATLSDGAPGRGRAAAPSAGGIAPQRSTRRSMTRRSAQ